MLYYLDEVDTLDDVDIDDDVDTELEVDTLTGKKRQCDITRWRRHLCTWYCFYLLVETKETHFLDEVDTPEDVNVDEDVENELQVEWLNERQSYLAYAKTHPKSYLDNVSLPWRSRDTWWSRYWRWGRYWTWRRHTVSQRNLLVQNNMIPEINKDGFVNATRVTIEQGRVPLWELCKA